MRSFWRAGWTLLLLGAGACLEHPPGGAIPPWAEHPTIATGELLFEVALPLEGTDICPAIFGAATLRSRPPLQHPRREGNRFWCRVTLTPDQSPSAVARQLRGDPRVGVVQPNYRYHPHQTPTDPFFGDQTAHQLTDAELAWDQTTGDPSVVVALLGSGIQLDHPELDGNLWHNAGETPGNDIDDDGNGFVDDWTGWNFENDDADPTGGDHETRVAGVIAAEANNDAGGAGVMWRAALMPLRIVYSSDQVAAAIDYAVDNGADVINMSFGIYLPQIFGEDSLVGEALERAENAGVVAVASAGNDDVLAPSYPAADATVLGVGATDNGDHRAGFSNAGGWVDVAAPGESLITASNGNQIVQVSGTSFAAPYASGLAGLLRAAHPTWSPLQIRQTIMVTGDPLSSDRPLGTCRVNLGSALTDNTRLLAQIRWPEDGTLVAPTAVEVWGTATGDTYTLEWRASGDTSWTTASGGGTTIDAELGRVGLDGVAPGVYQIRLTTTEGGNSRSAQVSVTLGPPWLPGWPVTIFGAPYSAPAFGDLDHDRRAEILISDAGHSATGDFVNGLAPDGSPLWFSPPWSPESSPNTPALGDIDGDGEIEIVVSTGDSGGNLYVWQHDGTAAPGWPRAVGAARAPAALAHLTGDGQLEIIVVADNGDHGTVWVWRANQTALPGWPQTVAGGNPTAPVIADFDGDGQPEIGVATATSEYLFGADGTVRDGWPRTIDGVSANPVAADFDGDGSVELVSRQRDRLELVSLTGEVVIGWPQSLSDSENDHLALGDLMDDEAPEIVLAQSNGQIHVFRADGTQVTGWPRDLGAAIEAPVVLADITGDGQPEVLACSPDGAIHAFRADGTTPDGFPIQLDGPAHSGPAVLDLNGDQVVDLVVGGSTVRWQVWAWSMGAPFHPAGMAWAQVGHDPHHTRYYPRRFAMTATEAAPPGTVTIDWTPPTDIPQPTAYVVWRDGEEITRVLNPPVTDTLDTPGEHAYQVFAMDESATVRAQSPATTLMVSEGIPPDSPDGGGAVSGYCGCRETTPLPSLGGLLLLLGLLNATRRHSHRGRPPGRSRS